MPRMDGLETLERIMTEMPRPVVMLSSYSGEGAELTFRALDLGAVDFIAKPHQIFSRSIIDIKTQILMKIEAASRIIVNKIDKKKLKMKGVKSVKIEGDRVTMTIDTSKVTCSDLIKKIISKWPIYDITIDELPVEEIIRKIYKRGFNVS